MQGLAEGDRSQAASQRAQLVSQGRELITTARYAEAYGLLMRAGKLAHEGSDLADESKCLALLAYAAACLGHNEEAIETAMLASQLADASMDVPARLMALNYLGVALLWNGSHEGAEAVLKPAFELACAQSRPGLCWRPQINRCFNEAYRQAGLRHLEQCAPDPQRLRLLMATLEQRDHGEAPQSPLTHGLWLWLRALAGAWQHGGAAAAADEQALAELCRLQADLGLLQAMLQWLRCEIAMADQRPDAALAAAGQMMELGERLHQHPLQRIALQLSCDLHQRQGQTARALACLRQLQRREHRLRQVSMNHRREAATLRLELRQHKREVQSLRSDAQHLQRLSMEDPLTGLSNRRGLERRLNAALAGEGRPDDATALYVSVVDVDAFKSVNDQHSHQVGDQVLQALAALFQQQLRSQDIAGRWGGDEFVLAFWAQDDLQAQGVITRLREAVASHPWARLAPGLSIAISLGLARALPDEKLEALLLRSDQGMYAHKRACSAGAQPDDIALPRL